MAAREGRMRMDDVDRLRTLKFAYPADDLREEERASSREPESGGKRKITEPVRRNSGFPALNLAAIKRLHREHCAYNPDPRQGFERLRDETARGIILCRRIERRQRQNVNRTIAAPQIFSR